MDFHGECGTGMGVFVTSIFTVKRLRPSVERQHLTVSPPGLSALQCKVIPLRNSQRRPCSRKASMTRWGRAQLFFVAGLRLNDHCWFDSLTQTLRS